MSFCTSEAVREHASGVIDPIYQGINEVTGVVEGVFDRVGAISGGVGELLRGFEEFVSGFMNSFRLVGTRVRMTFVRMKALFDRVYGVFLAFSFAAISAITFGQNMVCNPLVTFMGEITGVDTCCFAPGTRIALGSGGTKPIEEIRIGDRLKAGGTVTGLLQFDGDSVDMVDIRGVTVSGNHCLLHNGVLIPAGEHPAATAVLKGAVPRIYCLNTTNNRIPVTSADARTLWFTDYEETSDSRVAAEAQQIVNRRLGVSEGPVDGYCLGLDPLTPVILSDGGRRRLEDVMIGDVLTGGCRVTGVVEELCESVTEVEGVRMGTAQLFRGMGGWRRPGPVGPVGPMVLRHLIVEGHCFQAGGMWVRDYVEASEAQIPYYTFIAEL